MLLLAHAQSASTQALLSTLSKSHRLIICTPLFVYLLCHRDSATTLVTTSTVSTLNLQGTLVLSGRGRVNFPTSASGVTVGTSGIIRAAGGVHLVRNRCLHIF